MKLSKIIPFFALIGATSSALSLSSCSKAIIYTFELYPLDQIDFQVQQRGGKLLANPNYCTEQYLAEVNANKRIYAEDMVRAAVESYWVGHNVTKVEFSINSVDSRNHFLSFNSKFYVKTDKGFDEYFVNISKFEWCVDVDDTTPDQIKWWVYPKGLREASRPTREGYEWMKSLKNGWFIETSEKIDGYQKEPKILNRNNLTLQDWEELSYKFAVISFESYYLAKTTPTYN